MICPFGVDTRSASFEETSPVRKPSARRQRYQSVDSPDGTRGLLNVDGIWSLISKSSIIGANDSSLTIFNASAYGAARKEAQGAHRLGRDALAGALIIAHTESKRTGTARRILKIRSRLAVGRQSKYVLRII